MPRKKRKGKNQNLILLFFIICLVPFIIYAQRTGEEKRTASPLWPTAQTGPTPSVSAAAATLEFAFTRDFIESLKYQLAAAKIQKEIPPPDPEKEPSSAQINAFLKNIASANTNLSNAESAIAPYLESQNETIKKAAELIVSTYTKQIKLNEKTAKLYEKFLDPASLELDPFSQGKLLTAVSKLPLERKILTKQILDASVLTTHLLYSDIPDPSGKLSFLTITQAERNTLLEKISGIFGKTVSDSFSDAEINFSGCASVIQEVLVSAYKSADERT